MVLARIMFAEWAAISLEMEMQMKLSPARIVTASLCTVLTVLGVSRVVVSEGSVADVALDQAPAGTKNDDDDTGDAVFKISRVSYDRQCRALFVRALVINKSDRPLFFVLSDEFCYKHLDTGPFQLRILSEADVLTIDLSHKYPTAEGIQWAREEMGSLGPEPDVFELAPGLSRSWIYAFHFPLSLSPIVSPTPQAAAPRGRKSVRLKLGYAIESFESFRKKQLGKNDTVVEWQQKIVEKWQRTGEVETEDKLDFGDG